jgi:hypothetical protein
VDGLQAIIGVQVAVQYGNIAKADNPFGVGCQSAKINLINMRMVP